MPRKKKNVNENNQNALLNIGESIENSEITIIDAPLVTEQELIGNAKLLNNDDYLNKIMAQEHFLRSEKGELQKKLDKFKTPDVCEMPEFLLNPDEQEKRNDTFEKIRILLGHRFSLISIADMLESNNYDGIDELIERKKSLSKLVEEYTSEEGAENKIILFSKFKDVVGSEYSKVYSEQEMRVKAAITTLKDGKYFKKGAKKGKALEETKASIGDIISSVIDMPDFNLACKIEAEFIRYELDRAIVILSDLRSRSELQELIEELKSISQTIETRLYKCNVMNKLISGSNYSKDIIQSEDGER